MKEYALLIRNYGGKPYYLEKYFSLEEVKKVLYEIVELEEERGRPYYVDNDFFENKYPLLLDLKYVCIVSRDITPYEKFSENLNFKFENKKNSSDNKILYFNFKR